MSPLTLFDARNDATVRRAMQDAARTSSGVVFGDRLALTFRIIDWAIHVRAPRADVWTLAADGLSFDDAVDVVTHYARNAK